MTEEIIIENAFHLCQRLEQENRELKEEKLYRGIDRQFIEDANDRLYFKAEKYRKALEEIRDYSEKCKKCVETGDEVILYTVIKKVNEVLGND